MFAIYVCSGGISGWRDSGAQEDVFVEGDSNGETVTASVKNKKAEVTASGSGDRENGDNSEI